VHTLNSQQLLTPRKHSNRSSVLQRFVIRLCKAVYISNYSNITTKNGKFNSVGWFTVRRNRNRLQCTRQSV